MRIAEPHLNNDTESTGSLLQVKRAKGKTKVICMILFSHAFGETVVHLSLQGTARGRTLVNGVAAKCNLTLPLF